MSRLKRDWRAGPVSRDQILRRERGQGKLMFPCLGDHKQDWQAYPVIYTVLKVLTIQTYISIICIYIICAHHGCINKDIMFTVSVLYQHISNPSTGQYGHRPLYQ